ncbi:nucleotide exchange factor GrpE [Natronomonas salsuginis]|jgi:molecular chaperone GrpE|uniref:Protein GrpE n=1 Tax=Natronomonas salsuginis TaxID=2217661 RepID=A0A4U5J8Y5_9EURY|nr:nucleotide exchange factor GrpE [Natronomonas salsuginis]TKR25570.1 nucleotide exchange factor GrpE [Natronomonas salsuginis]
MSDEDGDAVETTAAADDSSAVSRDVEEPNEPSGGDPPIEEIAARIEGEPSASVAEEIATLREEVATLRTDRDDLEARLKRKQAEFQNYKKRQEKRREREKARATEALVEDLLEVRDNLSRALEQDESADIRDGVEATFRGLDEVLDGEGVEPIEPEPGTETDPNRHEVLLRVESREPEGTVADLHRPGYEMAGKVLRTAQVTVSDGSAGDNPQDESDE